MQSTENTTNGNARPSSRRVTATILVVVGGVIFYLVFFMDLKPGDASSSAVSALRTVATSNEKYKEKHGEYAGDLHDLQSDGLIDYVLANGVKGGFTFSYRRAADGGWSCNARPMTEEYGNVRLFVDETAVVRRANDQIADERSSPVD
jgi:hypothetical protein